MASKTLIGGTAYEISGGKTIVNGTAYRITNGKTIVGGTVYDISIDKLVKLQGSGRLLYTIYASVTIDGVEYADGTIPRNISLPSRTVISCYVASNAIGYQATITVNDKIVAKSPGTSGGAIIDNFVRYDYVVTTDATITIGVTNPSVLINVGTINITEH